MTVEPPPLAESLILAELHRFAGTEAATGLARRAVLRSLWFTLEQQLRFNEDVTNALASVASTSATDEGRLRHLEDETANIRSSLERRSRALTEQLLASVAALESVCADIELEIAELRSAVAVLGDTSEAGVRPFER